VTLLWARLAHIFQCLYGYEGWPISSVKLRLVCQSVWNSVQQELTMPQFDSELIQLMRTVLEDAMTRVPLEISGTTTKAYLAEVILKAAAQGQTSYSDLITAATDQIHTLTSMLM
jgi:hypothetical protein